MSGRTSGAEADYWLLFPAAGRGERMESKVPKQYLPLAGKNVIAHALAPFDGNPLIQCILVLLAPHDGYWSHEAPQMSKPVQLVEGGPRRVDSVLNGLRALDKVAQPGDWVLIHDAARPCLTGGDLEKLLLSVHADPVGGMLAAPVRESLQRSGEPDRDGVKRVETGIDGRHVWRALSPQMFRYSLLRDAVEASAASGEDPVDEVSAVERAGHHPHIVEGRSDNIRVIFPEDLALAETILRTREARRRNA